MIQAGAANAMQKHPIFLTALNQCRREVDIVTRAQCYDKIVEQMNTEVSAGDLAIIDRRSQKRAETKSFGMPGVGHSPEDAERVSRIESRIVNLRPNADGSWMIALADGSTWRSSGGINGKIKAGSSVAIVRDGFSRYKMSSGTDRKTIVYRVR